MARPKKNEPERRNIRLNFRVTNSEAATISTVAKRAGLSVSDYIRTIATEGKVVTVENSAPPLKLIFAVNKNGVLLNQIAKKLHQSGQLIPAELARAVEDVNLWLSEAKRRDCQSRNG